MTIKVEVEVHEVTGMRTYPYIGKSEKSCLVVLFTSPRSGVCMVGDHVSDSGVYRNHWLESNFTPLPKGTTITLTQE
jgi:hypothetical protein